MARLNNEQEILHDLRTVGFLDDTATASTIEAASPVAVGDITVTLAIGGGASFTAGDTVRLGLQSGICDVAVIDSIAVDVLTLVLPVAFAHAGAEPVTLLTFVDMGKTSEDGVSFETTQEETPLAAGTQRNTCLFIPGSLEEAIVWQGFGFNPQNLAQMVGLDEDDTDVIPGTDAGIQLNPNNFATLGSKPWQFEGFREDLTTVTAIAANAKVATVNATQVFTTGQATLVPMNLRSTGHRSYIIQ